MSMKQSEIMNIQNDDDYANPIYLNKYLSGRIVSLVYILKILSYVHLWFFVRRIYLNIWRTIQTILFYIWASEIQENSNWTKSNNHDFQIIKNKNNNMITNDIFLIWLQAIWKRIFTFKSIFNFMQ